MADTQKAISYTAEELDAAIPKAQGALQTTGGTMTGALTLTADPTEAMQAATKQYVDNNTPTGVVKSVNGASPDENGNVEVTISGALPTASETVKGGVMIGEGLQINGEVLGVDPALRLTLVNEITVSESIRSVVVTQDSAGNPLALKNAFVRIDIPIAAGTWPILMYLNEKPCVYHGGGTNISAERIIKAFFGTLTGYIRITDFFISGSGAFDGDIGGAMTYKAGYMETQADNISEIKIDVNPSEGLWPVGTKLQIYEVNGYA